MNKIKLIFSSLAIIAVSALAPAMLIASSASAAPDPNPYNIKGQTCDGANGQPVKGGDGSCKSGADENTLPEIVAFIINVFSWIVGAVSVIMIIYGGFRYITSGGDSNGVTAAKNTILYAIIGLIIVALAQVIVNFVLVKAGDATTTTTLILLT